MKTGTDTGAAAVNASAALSTSIATMSMISAPGSLPNASRIAPLENSLFVVDATLTAYRLAEDSDYYLILTDTSGKTMVVEVPHPSCVGDASPFKSAITAARNTFDRTLRTATSFKNSSIPVRVYGIGFFDSLHGQTGVASNGAGLHPVLQIEFNPTQPASASTSFPLISDVDRLFNWAEATYPQYFPKPSVAGTYLPYTYRYYSGTGNYMGAGNGRALVHNGRDWNFLDVGAIADFLGQATQGGY